MLCGMERALTDVVDNPAFTQALLEKIAGLDFAVTRHFLEATGKYLTAIRTSDDLATQSSLMMSPAAYRKLVKPYHQRYFRLIKEYTEAKIFFHLGWHRHAMGAAQWQPGGCARGGAAAHSSVWPRWRFRGSLGA